MRSVDNLTEEQLKVLFVSSLFDIGDKGKFERPPLTKEGWSRNHGRWEEDILEMNVRNIFPEIKKVRQIIDSLIEKGVISVKNYYVASYNYRYYAPSTEYVEKYSDKLRNLGDAYIDKILQSTSELEHLKIVALETLLFCYTGFGEIFKESPKDSLDDLSKKGLLLFSYQVYTGRYPYIYFLPENRICPAASALIKEILLPEILDQIEKHGAITHTMIETLFTSLRIRPEDFLVCLRVAESDPEVKEKLGERLYELMYLTLKLKHKLTDDELEEKYRKLKAEKSVDDYFFEKDLMILGVIKEGKVNEVLLESVFAPLKKKWKMIETLLDYVVSDYIGLFPEEWKSNIKKSVRYMIDGDSETAFMHLAAIIEKFSEEIANKNKMELFKKKAKERLREEIRLQSEKNKISLNVENILKFAEKYFESLRELSDSMKKLRNVAFHKSSFFEFYVDQYLSILLMMCVIAKILNAWGWNWYE